MKGEYKLFLQALLLVGVMTAVIAADSVLALRSLPQCRDGIDNDGDTFADYPYDPGCKSRTDNSELGTTKCDNGVNDDRDGLVDYPDDPGCSSPSDNSELGAFQCDNGLNDDNDGLVDYPADPGCTSPTDSTELGTVQCDDNADNDFDGFRDYPADSGCSSALDNSEGTNSCTDTDGRFNPNVQGTASGIKNGQPFRNTDFCLSSITLLEFYCAGTTPANSTYNCAGNVATQCINGACVPLLPRPPLPPVGNGTA